MPPFYTMFCYVARWHPLWTLRNHCKYHASGLPGLVGDPLAHPWWPLGCRGVSLEPPWGSPGAPWGLLGVPSGAVWSPSGCSRGLPGVSRDSLWGPLGLSRDSLGTPPGLPGGRRCGSQVVRLRPVGVPPGSYMSIDTYRAHRSCWTSGRGVLHR